MDEALEKLLQNPRIWRGQAAVAAAPGLPSGYPSLDRHLPGGGWPQAALTEILLEHYGTGELELLMPALARLSRSAESGDPGARWLVWVAPPMQPYPPALAQWGIDLSRVLIVRPAGADEALWAAEQALAAGNCAAVLLWPGRLDDTAGRRLQLAAEAGGSWAIAFRPLAALSQPSAAALRLLLVAAGGGTELRIVKNRGARPVILRNVLRDHAG